MLVNSTYKKEDCIFLLKDLTNIIPSTSLEEKEKMIANGRNYSEMITDESAVSITMNQLFQELVQDEKKDLAKYIAIVSQGIMELYRRPILVSLARAGTPIGVLIKRYIKFKYNIDLPHYSISIIREKGIDENAIKYILKKEDSENLVFIDGWTGKGSITRELEKSITQYNQKYKTHISSDLVVLADPAKKSLLSGTKKDICIPNACLNSTVSGLVSRTIENCNYINETDFHGAKVFSYLKDSDYTNYFIDEIEKEFSKERRNITLGTDKNYVSKVLKQIMTEYKITDQNKIKLSIGETSRALIRRIPKLILVKDKTNSNLKFILEMAKEKDIEVKETNTFDYECIGILK